MKMKWKGTNIFWRVIASWSDLVARSYLKLGDVLIEMGDSLVMGILNI